jgi:hypothetical protein
VVAQGWNVDWLAGCSHCFSVSTPVPSLGGDGTRGVWGAGRGTLLGPEGTGAGCVSFLLWAASSVEPSVALPVRVGVSWWSVGVCWCLVGVVGRRRVWGWFPPVA